MAETINGLYKAEVIWRQRSWPSASAVEVQPCAGLTGSTTTACSAPSGTFRLLTPRPTTMQPTRPSIWSHDSNETASGKPGTLQPVNRLAEAIEWLTDNGSPYIAGETRRFARDIGLLPRSNPRRQSLVQRYGGGIRPQPQTRLRSREFQARCTGRHRTDPCMTAPLYDVHPLKALGYRSPREYIQQTREAPSGIYRQQQKKHQDHSSYLNRSGVLCVLLLADQVREKAAICPCCRLTMRS